MAQKVSVLLLCDLHANGDVEAVETLRFGLGSATYEVDVCTMHAGELRGKIQPYADHARRANGTRPRRRSRGAADRAHTAEVRAWAKEHGHQLSDRGRIPATVAAEYDQTH
jgi:nucleoid-associated protein Lsr2